eukprot:g7824.t1
MSAPAGDEKKDPPAPAPAKQPPLAPKRKIRKPPGKPAFEIVSRVYQGNDDSLALVLVQSATKLYAGLSVDYARKPEEMPRVTVPNVYGYRDETFSRNEMFFNEALEQRNSLNLVWPLQRGVVEDWEALEKIWRRLFLNPKLELDVRIEVRKKDAPPVEEDGFAAAAAVAAKKAAKKKKGDVDESDEDDSLTKTDTAAVFKMSKNFWNVSMKNEQLSTSDKDNLQKAGLLGQKLAKLKGSQDAGIVKQGNAAPAGGGGASSHKEGGGSGAGTDPDEEIVQHPLLNRYPILITEAPWTTKLDRERMAKILFDTFDAVAIAVCQTPSLVLASHGRSTGCIVDLGETATSAVCVFEGYLMAHTVQKQDWGGKKVVELLLRYLRTEQNIEFFGEEWRQEQAGAEVLRKMGFVLTNGPTEMQLCPPKNYECKMTGRIHSIKTERCRCLEALFQPSMFKRPLTNAEQEEEKYKKMLGILSPEVNYQQYALHELVFHSINAAHYKTRAALYENIILTGGLSRVTNLAERLKRELGKMPFVRAMMNVTHELLPMYDEQKEFDAIMKQLRAEQQLQMSSDLDGSRLSIGSGQGSVLSEESLASTLANSFTSINPGGLPRPGQRKKSIGMKIRIHEPPAELRDFDCDTTEAYLGAAALASMDSFEQLHFTRKEYDSEEGLSTLHGKVV